MWPVIMSNGQAATFSSDLSCNASSNSSSSCQQQHVARAATGPTAATAAGAACCYSLPTHTSSPPLQPLPLPLHILSSFKSNSICSKSNSKWKMSTTRAHGIAFPIAIKNIYNANAADQCHRAQWYKNNDKATHRVRVAGNFHGICATHSVRECVCATPK